MSASTPAVSAPLAAPPPPPPLPLPPLAAAATATATATRRRRTTGGSGSRLGFLRRWISPVALVGLWQLASVTGVLPEKKLAAPTQIFTTAVELIADGTLGPATLVSLQRVGVGFAIGAVVALVLAVVAGLDRVGNDAVDPIMQMLRTLPHFGLIPLLIIWMGVGEAPKVALIAMGVAFPLYLNTLAGISGIESKMLDAARSMNLTWGQRLRHVVIPGALPQTLTGLRQSLGIAWLSLIVAETISAGSGLGYTINLAREFQRTDIVVVGLAVYSILGLVTDAIVRNLERRALAWRS